MSEDRQGNLVPDLSRKSIGIIGLGMHGSWTALTVSRLGIGRLLLWDFDVVSDANFTNQLYPIYSRNKPKVGSMAEMLNLFVVKLPKLYVLGEFLHAEYHVITLDVLICCADSFAVRREAAQIACKCNTPLFIESRSAMNTAFIHSFKPTAEKVDVYLSTCFPSDVEQTTCGDTGTAAMGAAIAAEIAASVFQSTGGEHPELIPEEKIITLGYGTQVRMAVFNKI